MELPDEIEKYRISAPSEKMHHLLYYADMFVGESATMATESAILGTPAIFVSTSRRGYTDELETKYDLLYTFSNSKDIQNGAINKAAELLNDKNTKEEWQRKRGKFLEDKVDVTAFMVNFIESYEQKI
jgi:predicted glycosyltransferase